MKCLECGRVTEVTDSRPTDGGTRRRRVCGAGHRFTTYERPAADLERLDEAARVLRRLRALDVRDAAERAKGG